MGTVRLQSHPRSLANARLPPQFASFQSGARIKANAKDARATGLFVEVVENEL